MLFCLDKYGETVVERLVMFEHRLQSRNRRYKPLPPFGPASLYYMPVRSHYIVAVATSLRHGRSLSTKSLMEPTSHNRKTAVRRGSSKATGMFRGVAINVDSIFCGHDARRTSPRRPEGRTECGPCLLPLTCSRLGGILKPRYTNDDMLLATRHGSCRRTLSHWRPSVTSKKS